MYLFFRAPVVKLALILAILFVRSSVSGQTASSYFEQPITSLKSTSSLKFIENRGQFADQFGRAMPEVRYMLEANGMKFYFTKNSVHYVFTKGYGKIDREHHVLDSLSFYRVDAHFIGSNAKVEITATDTTADYTNYYLAQCPDGITHVPGFQRIIYHNLYPHIDLIFYTSAKDGHNLEYDFIIHPGGDVRKIRIGYDHATSLGIEGDGSFRLASPFGHVTDLEPTAYQERRDVRTSVNCDFYLVGNELRFRTNRYNRRYDLIIDPERLWGTYFGSSGTNNSTSITDLAIDRVGDIDIVGKTACATNIATTGAYQTTFAGLYYDGFIARFTNDGKIRWSTYYGGTGYNDLNAVACDAGLGLLIAGSTTSTSGIASPGAYQTTITAQWNAMLLSFDSSGSRRWATYYGTNGSYGKSVAVDSASNIILSANDDYWISLAKFSPTGSKLWTSTFSGDKNPGTTLDGMIGVDASNNIYVGAYTIATSGIATPGAFQSTFGWSCFAKFNPSGSKVWATYFGDSIPYSLAKQINHISVSPSGNLYFVGVTRTAWLASPGAYQTSIAGDSDAMLGKFNTNGQRIWTTMYGGSYDDRLYGITLDSAENIYACGETESPIGIATTNEYQTNLLGVYDPFFIKFDSSGHRKWGTYYGTKGLASAIGVDRKGYLFIGGTTQTTSSEYASAGAFDTVAYAGNNGFIAKFCDEQPPVHITGSLPSGLICPNVLDTLTTKAGETAYLWFENGENTAVTNQNFIFRTPSVPGTYNYAVNVICPNMCPATSDTFRITVRPAPQITFPTVNTVCPGSSIKLTSNITGNGPFTYSWSPALTLDHPDSAEPIATPAKATVYNLTVTDIYGCTSTKPITVTMYPAPKVKINAAPVACSGTPYALTATGTNGVSPYTYSWNPTTTLDRNDSSTVFALPKTNGFYTVTITDANGCTSKDSLFVIVQPPPKIAPGPPLSVCHGSSIKIGSTIKGGKQPYTIQWSPANGLSDPTLLQPIASPASTTMYTLLVTDKNGCTALDSVLVAVSDSLSPTVSASGALTICTGDTVRLSAGTGYSSYVWSTGEKTPEIAVTTTGDYSVRVTNSTGCAGTSSSVHVTVLPDKLPYVTLEAPTTTLCGADTVTITATGGWASYRWNTGDTTSWLVVSKPGTYYVTVANSRGCTSTSTEVTFTSDVKPNIQVRANGTTTFCSGDSVTLTATTGYHYTWWNGGTKLSDTGANLVVRTSGSYAVTATTNGGCDTTTSPITIAVKPTPSVTIDGPSSICIGTTAGYRIHSPSGSTVLWQVTPPNLGTIASGQGTDSVSIDWGSAGSGSLSVAVLQDGCTGSASIPITIDSHLIPLVTANGPLAFCAGDSVTLDASVGYASYQWSINGSPIANAINERITVSQAGSYSVFVTNSDGCNGTSKNIDVTVYPIPAKPVISQTGQQLISTSASSYQWLLDGNTISGATTQNYSPTKDGDYSVIITDVNGCSATSDAFNYTNTSGSVTLSLPPVIALIPNEAVTIPVVLSDLAGLIEAAAKTFTGTVRVGTNLLTPTTPLGTQSGSDWLIPVSGNIQSGIDTLARLSFTAGTLAPDCGPIVIDTFYFPGKPIHVMMMNGTVCISGVCTPWVSNTDTSTFIHSILPNPFSGSFTVEYRLAEDGPATLTMEDMIGREAIELTSGWKQAGTYRETYTPSGLASGVYRLELRSGNRIVTKRLELTR